MGARIKAMGLALAVTASAAAESEPRGQALEPLDPEQMETTQVPLQPPSTDSNQELTGDEWLEQQRRLMLDDPLWGAPRKVPEPARKDSPDGLSPFQQDFRDAFIRNLENSARQSR